MSENNNNKASEVTNQILELGEKHGIGKIYKTKRSNDKIQNEAVGSLSDFVVKISKLDINKDTLDNISKSDPELATYVKFALLHKAEQKYIFERNFEFKPEGFSYEELRDINNASLDCDRHAAFDNHGSIRRAINKDFKPSMLFRLRTDYGDLKTVEDEKYYSLVVEPKTKKHDIEKVAKNAGITLDKNEQKLVSELMKQMDEDKSIPTGFESACGITEATKDKLKAESKKLEEIIKNLEQKEKSVELKLKGDGFDYDYTDYYLKKNKLSKKSWDSYYNREKLERFIGHVEKRQANIEEKDFVRKKITLGTHISMKDLESKFGELDKRQKELEDRNVLEPLNFSQDYIFTRDAIKNVHKEQEKGMREPSETLKQKNEILKQRSELESRMKRKLGRTWFFRFGKRKKLREQINENHTVMNKIIKSIAPDEIHNLSFYSLTPETLAEMSKSQIINIPKDQIRKLDQEQIGAIGTKLSDEELGYIQNINFGLDSKQIDDDQIKFRAKFVEPRAMNFIDIKKMRSGLLCSFTRDQIRALSMKKMANLDEKQFEAIKYKRRNREVEEFVYKKQKESKDYSVKLNDDQQMFPREKFSSLSSVFKLEGKLSVAMANNVECYEAVCDTAQKNKINIWAKSKNGGTEKTIYFGEKNYDISLKEKIGSLNDSQEEVANAKKNLNDALGNVDLKNLENELNNLILYKSEDRNKLLNPLIKDVLKAKKENTTLLGQGLHKIKNFFRSKFGDGPTRNTRDIINDIEKKIKKAEIGAIAKSEVNNRLKDNKEEDKNLDQELEALKRDSKSPEELRDEKQMKDYKELKDYGLTDQDIEDIESGNEPYEDDYDLKKNSFDVKQKLGFDDAEKENKNTRRRNSIAGTGNKLAAGVEKKDNKEQNKKEVQQENQVKNKEQKESDIDKVMDLLEPTLKKYDISSRLSVKRNVEKYLKEKSSSVKSVLLDLKEPKTSKRAEKIVLMWAGISKETADRVINQKQSLFEKTKMSQDIAKSINKNTADRNEEQNEIKKQDKTKNDNQIEQ